MVPQLPPEIQLAQRLAGNEQVTRDRAVRKLRKYIVARTQRAAGWRVARGAASGTGPAGWGRGAAGRGGAGAAAVPAGWPPNHVVRRAYGGIFPGPSPRHLSLVTVMLLV